MCGRPERPCHSSGLQEQTAGLRVSGLWGHHTNSPLPVALPGVRGGPSWDGHTASWPPSPGASACQMLSEPKVDLEGRTDQRRLDLLVKAGPAHMLLPALSCERWGAGGRACANLSCAWSWGAGVAPPQAVSHDKAQLSDLGVSEAEGGLKILSRRRVQGTGLEAASTQR